MKTYDGLLFDLDGTLRDSSLPRVSDIVPLYAGVAEGMKALAKRYTLFIVSGCEEDDLRAFLKASGFHKIIKDWECTGRTGLEKATNIRSVVTRNSLTQPVYIGDSEADESAARKAGLPFLHVEYGFGSAMNPLMAFRHFDELKAFLLD